MVNFFWDLRRGVEALSKWHMLWVCPQEAETAYMCHIMCSFSQWCHNIICSSSWWCHHMCSFSKWCHMCSFSQWCPNIISSFSQWSLNIMCSFSECFAEERVTRTWWKVLSVWDEFIWPTQGIYTQLFSFVTIDGKTFSEKEYVIIQYFQW